MKVVVIGAGIGGLAAALRVAREGHDVTIVEARHDAGGLAGSVEFEGHRFDAGPYILLDRPGLDWALDRLGVSVDLQRLDDVVYEVTWADAPPVRIYADAARTADEIGSSRYLPFIEKMRATYEQLAPMLRVSRPRPWRVWRQIPFLLKSLERVMRESGLPPRVVEALTIWTHVAGQSLREAPSPMAFVPALIHTHGAWLPRGGTSAIARALRDEAVRRGIAIQYGTRVQSIDEVQADAVISNHSAIGTYVDLLPSTPPRVRRRLAQLPLQSPGACAYIVAKVAPREPYLRFRLRARAGEVAGATLSPPHAPGLSEAPPPSAALRVANDGTVRLIVPGRDADLDAALRDPWWHEGLDDIRILHRRTPREWGAEYTLYRDSMNAVMTGAFMRRGRIAHRSPYRRGLYLAGSSTHPGQWISFCAISGVLAAEALLEDHLPSSRA